MRSVQKGFSLVELLIVLGLMATAATLALSTVGNNNNQNRFNETRGKLEKLRDAIAGETKTINGQTIINGFVADMGRLPFNVNELLAAPADCDHNNILLFGDAIASTIDSDDDSDNAIDPCPWGYDADVEMWHGWNGPYVLSIREDYRDGWGNDDDDDPDDTNETRFNNGWGWELENGNLTITSAGLDNDINNDLTDPESAIYGTSAFQSTTLPATQTSVTLPSEPLVLAISNAPFCGQCRADEFVGVNAEVDCILAADHQWNDELSYCVEASPTTISATTCDTVEIDGVENTTWVPLYFESCITDNTYTNQVDCEAAGKTWGGHNNSGTCPTASPNPSYDFTGGNSNICVRIIRINNGQVVIDTHLSTDLNLAQDIDIRNIGQSAAYDFASPSCEEDSASPNCFSFEPHIEDNTGTIGLTLPHGVMRIGLYEYDTATNTCTTNPYPTASAQAISDVITLSSNAPPNIGTTTNPIPLQWRSQ
ncbi:hypothetical protein A9Q99_05275 [Gammaproteobacteria bacterium 45_16_T64]|nr:hypothetical protein A9Q99_05275 [Gammaproteobacteria bacterium 45_16_T64]